MIYSRPCVVSSILLSNWRTTAVAPQQTRRQIRRHLRAAPSSYAALCFSNREPWFLAATSSAISITIRSFIRRYLLGSNDCEHQCIYNDTPNEDTLHLGIILHDHGLAILDNGRFQMVPSGCMTRVSTQVRTWIACDNYSLASICAEAEDTIFDQKKNLVLNRMRSKQKTNCSRYRADRKLRGTSLGKQAARFQINRSGSDKTCSENKIQKNPQHENAHDTQSSLDAD